MPLLRRLIYVLTCSLSACLAAGIFVGAPSISALCPSGSWFSWFRAATLGWALVSIGVFLAFFLWRHAPTHNPGRRNLLRATGAALAATPLGATAFGIVVERRSFRIQEVTIYVPELPRDLEGLRLVQLSDIHLGPFLGPADLARVVDMSNEVHAHLALVTGDLITSKGDPLDLRLQHLARLRAEAGILGCLGNHEGYTHLENETVRLGAKLGVRFLRKQALTLPFGQATLNVAGVDYQSYYRPYLRKAERLIDPDSFNVLLSHNPDVFPVAARQGWNLILAGHTHGGQVNVEIFDQPLNLARFYTPFVYGLYRRGASSIYVSRGIGTVGIPARIGAPPEIALVRLSGSGTLLARKQQHS